MIKFVSLYTHTNTDACLGSFLSVVWIVYFPFETLILFEHVHLEWTYSQVPTRVYYSSVVGLRLLVKLEKSLIPMGPHRYVWSETRHVSVWTWWGGPREDSSKPRCFWRIFTLWQLWQKPTPTPWGHVSAFSYMERQTNNSGLMAKLYMERQAKFRERTCLGTKDKETNDVKDVY